MKIQETVHFDWYKKAFILFILVVCFVVSANATEADFIEVFTNSDQMANFLGRLIHPDFSYLPEILSPLLMTLKMSVFGTALGVLFAVPVAFLATEVVTHNKVITTVVRFILNVVRTIPTLLLAALAVAVIGIGEFTGVVTIAIFTFGIVSQLVFESIETIDFGPIEAAEAVGATRTQIAFWSILPQVTSQIAGYIFYALEINVRASTVLGYVGAGGIGVILNSSLALLQYERVSIIILTILVTVAIVDFLSEAIRRRLI